MATIFVFVCLSRFCVALLTWSRLFSPFGALTISARAGWVNVNAAAATSAHADVRATAACVGIRLTSLGGPHRGRKTADLATRRPYTPHLGCSYPRTGRLYLLVDSVQFIS